MVGPGISIAYRYKTEGANEWAAPLGKSFLSLLTRVSFVLLVPKGLGQHQRECRGNEYWARRRRQFPNDRCEQDVLSTDCLPAGLIPHFAVSFRRRHLPSPPPPPLLDPQSYTILSTHVGRTDGGVVARSPRRKRTTKERRSQPRLRRRRRGFFLFLLVFSLRLTAQLQTPLLLFLAFLPLPSLCHSRWPPSFLTQWWCHCYVLLRKDGREAVEGEVRRVETLARGNI